MSFKAYKVQIDDASTILAKNGLMAGGRVQKHFANEVLRVSDPYVPMASGILKMNTAIALDGTYVEYVSPYARVHWYGMVMVGKVPKTATNIPMNYNGAPMRGPKWVERAWADNGDAITRGLEKFMKGK